MISLIEKQARIRQFIVGVAEDFWKDAPYDPALFKRLPPKLNQMVGKLLAPRTAPATHAATPAAKTAAPAALARWHAQAGEVAEKMWGEERVLPASDVVMEMLTAPLGIDKDHNLLDLTAGLGGALHPLLTRLNQLKGLEPDETLALRGMDMSHAAGNTKHAPISGYDPATFSMPKDYDYVIARELFYRVADKKKFFAAIVDCFRSKGQIAFTDFIVDPENKEKPAILAWKKHEKATPLGLIEMAELWAKCGFEMRASDDQTALYRKEILAGLKRFVMFLGQSPLPDAATKKVILTDIEIWVHRMAALEQGMKFYRFHAVKS